MSEKSGLMSEMTSLEKKPLYKGETGGQSGTLTDKTELEPRVKSIDELEAEISSYKNLIKTLKEAGIDNGDNMKEAEEKLFLLEQELKSRLKSE